MHPQGHCQTELTDGTRVLQDERDQLFSDAPELIKNHQELFQRRLESILRESKSLLCLGKIKQDSSDLIKTKTGNESADVVYLEFAV